MQCDEMRIDDQWEIAPRPPLRDFNCRPSKASLNGRIVDRNNGYQMPTTAGKSVIADEPEKMLVDQEGLVESKILSSVENRSEQPVCLSEKRTTQKKEKGQNATGVQTKRMSSKQEDIQAIMQPIAASKKLPSSQQSSVVNASIAVVATVMMRKPSAVLPPGDDQLEELTLQKATDKEKPHTPVNEPAKQKDAVSESTSFVVRRQKVNAQVVPAMTPTVNQVPSPQKLPKPVVAVIGRQSLSKPVDPVLEQAKGSTTNGTFQPESQTLAIPKPIPASSTSIAKDTRVTLNQAGSQPITTTAPTVQRPAAQATTTNPPTSLGVEKPPFNQTSNVSICASIEPPAVSSLQIQPNVVQKLPQQASLNGPAVRETENPSSPMGSDQSEQPSTSTPAFSALQSTANSFRIQQIVAQNLPHLVGTNAPSVQQLSAPPSSSNVHPAQTIATQPIAQSAFQPQLPTGWRSTAPLNPSRLPQLLPVQPMASPTARTPAPQESPYHQQLMVIMQALTGINGQVQLLNQRVDTVQQNPVQQLKPQGNDLVVPRLDWSTIVAATTKYEMEVLNANLNSPQKIQSFVSISKHSQQIYS